MRSIDPCSREGRELLASGQVRFWREDRRSREAVPVRDLFRELTAAARDEHRHQPQGQGACNLCGALGHWSEVYTGHGKRSQ